MDSTRGRFLSLREVIVLLLVALPLLVTVSVIERADWVKGLPSLKILVLVSVVPWAFLARSRVPWWVGHPIAILSILAVSVILGAFTLSSASGLGDLANELGTWVGAIGSSEGHRGEIAAGVWLIGLTLWMGYASVWLAYRHSPAFLAALPGLGVLMVLFTLLSSDYYGNFFLYLLAAAPGIAYRHKGAWAVVGSRIPLVGTLITALVLMGVTLVSVWRIPAPEDAVLAMPSPVEETWYSVTDLWSNLFYGAPNRKDFSFFSLSLDLPFTGPVIDPGDDPVFVVESEEPHRWRMRVYETYTSTGWVSDEPAVKATSKEASSDVYLEGLKARRQVEIGVRLHTKSNALVSVGEPLDASIPHQMGLSPQRSFKLYVEGEQLSFLPPGLAIDFDGLALGTDSSSGAEPGDSLVPPSADVLVDLGFRVVQTQIPVVDGSAQETQDPGATYIVVEREESNPGLPLALLGGRVLVPPRGYSTVGSISTATSGMLRGAGQDYPDWVTDRYLQLPVDFPETVKDLARELTQNTTNPYDMAEAIRVHLGTLPYTLSTGQPAPGQDWVEFFLFVDRKGYCQNYASAMITMLRSLGIPSRLVVGFAPGVWDQGGGVWRVNSRHYHAWPEVHFPEYAWVEFEPTPADVQDALEHLDIRPQGRLVSSPTDLDPCSDPFLLELCANTREPIGDVADLLDALLDEDGNPVAGGAPAQGGSGPPWAFLGLGLALALALTLPVGAVSYVRWSIPRLGYATVIYASMGVLGRLGGVGLRPYDTPWEYCARLSRALPEHADSVTRMTRGFVATRYSPSKGLTSSEIEGVLDSWRALRRPLLRLALLRLLRRRRSPSGTD